MDNSILVGQYIYTILSEYTELTNLVSSDKIFPLMAIVEINPDTGEEQDITFPFITFSRESLTPVYTKDLLTENQVVFTIICVSDEYKESLLIANSVRHALESKFIRNEEITISRIKLDSIQEETIENAYVQKMQFSFTAR